MGGDRLRKIVLNLSSYIIGFLNSFVDSNPFQVIEQVIRQYAAALKRGAGSRTANIYRKHSDRATKNMCKTSIRKVC